MKILIGTPCGGGQVTAQYMISLLDVFQRVTEMKQKIFVRDNLRQAKAQGMINQQQIENLKALEMENLINFEIGLYTLSQESLLTRGRNHIAAVAIRGGWDKLMFIDADAKWSFQDFLRVVTSPHDLTAGACPLKCFPISLNYLPFEDDEHYYKDMIRSVDSLLKMRDGHKKQYIPVAYIGTAFMCISRKLLLMAAEKSEEYQYPNPGTGNLHTHWNMFAATPKHGKFMSEDWYFCDLAREMGLDVMLDSNVIISHVGNHMFSPDQAHITHKSEGVHTA